MGSIITTKKGLLKLVKGQIEVEVNGSNQPAKDGEQLPKGAVLHIGENATYEITFDDGTKLSNEIEVNPASAAVVVPVTGEATPDEIQALQDLIASGEDPTKNLPETAAGNAPASDGNSGYVSLARDGSEALATSGYSTSGQTLAAFAPDTPEQSIATDSPSLLANDSITVDEDSAATGNVLSNDSDIDSTLSVVSFTVNGNTVTAGTTVALEGGSLIINADGSYTFTPNANWNGQVPVITYTTNTGATATLTINITPVDDPSVLVNDTNTVAEDSVATGNVLSNDSDIDSTLSVVSFTINGNTVTAGTSVALEGGSLIINADGSYTFTPNANWNGQVPVITYTTNTGSTATLTINVTPVDDPSVLVNDTNTVAEDSVATGNVLSNDSDIDSTLSVVSFTINGNTVTAGTSVALEGGSLTINADGSYTFTPNANWNGTVPVITYTTNTGATATLTINVTPVDDPSVLANDTNTVDENTVATGNVLDNDSDVDNELSVTSFTVNGQTVAAGTTVTLEGGSLVINADGSYTFTPNEFWNGQVPVITYTTNTGSTATLTINITPVANGGPSVTITTDTNNDGFISNEELGGATEVNVTIGLEGTGANAGDTLTVNGVDYILTQEDIDNGFVNLTLPAPAEGETITVVATITDAAGNTSPEGSDSAVLDTTGPVITVSAPDDTQDTTPTITGTTDAPPGSTITIVVTDSTGAQQTLTTTVNPDGTYAVDVTNPIAEGGYTADASVTDPAGNTGKASDNGSVDTKIDQDGDGNTVAITAITQDTGSSSSDFITNDNTLIFKGTVDLGDNSTLAVTINGVVYTTANGLVIDAQGNWSVDLTGTVLPDGTYPVSATVTDVAGNSKTVTQDVVIDTKIDQDGDGNTVAITAITQDTGSSSSDFITNDNTLIFKGTVDLGDNSTLAVTINGVVYTTANGLVIDAQGNWSVDLTGTVLPDGTYPVSATVTDVAGNSKTVTQDVVIDTKIDQDGDGNTVAITAITQDTGSSSSDFITNDNTLIFKGTVDLGDNSTLAVTINGVVYTTANGLVIDAQGNWSVDLTGTALPDGTYPVSATVTDVAGNSKTVTQDVVIDTKIDQDGDGNTVAITAITQDTGSSSSDFITNDNTLIFKGTVDLGDNSTLAVTINGVVYTTANGLVIDAQGNWSVDLTGTVLPDGTYPVSATVTDVAGNSKTVTQDVVIDTKIDQDGDGNTVAITAITQDTGSSSSDFITNDNTLIFKGTVDLGDNSTLAVTINGVVYTTANGLVIDAQGNWSVDLTGTVLPDGTYPVSATVTDVAGNSKTVTQDVVIDTKIDQDGDGNTVAITAITQDTGSSSSDFITNDNTLIFKGTVDLGDNSTLAVTINGVVYTTANGLVIDAQGNWSVDLTGTVLPDGTYPVSATVTDVAGNSKTVTQDVVIDTQSAAAPTVTIDEDLNNDGFINTTELTGPVNITVTVGLGTSIGDLLIVKDQAGNTLFNGLVTQEILNNGLQLEIIAPAIGTNLVITAVVTDQAGNSTSGQDQARLTDSADDSKTVVEDTVASGNVLTNDEAGNTSVVSFTVAGSSVVHNAGSSVVLTGGTLVLNSNGSYSFTPNANWNGAVPVITYTTNTGAIATLTITVTPDNTDAANDSKTVVEDTVASGNVLTNDEAGNTSVVSFTVAGSSVVHNAGSSVVLTGGTLVLNSNGSYSFTPNANWNGAVPVITYTTNTGAIATLTITVTPDNTDAANDSKTVVEDTVASGNVLTNDEAGNTSVVSFTVAGSSVVHNAGSSVVLTGGTLVLNSNGSYSFTPNANWNGAVPVITYTTNTGAIATLTITVTPDNTDAANDSKTVVEDTVASGNVLTNDEAGNTSVVSFTVAGSSVVHNAGSSVVLTGGTLVLNSNGSYSFTPNANWNGAVPVITYTTNTGAIATLTITVTPDNTDAANDSKTVVEDTVASGNVLTNDEAGNTSVVSFTVAGSSVVHNAGSSVVLTGGTLVLNSNGSYSFTPNANWNGAVPVITYTTNTGAIATLTITVTPDNTDAANDSKTVVEDTVASGNVLTNDEAGNTSVVSFTVAGSSVVHNAGSSVVLTGGTLVLNSNGSYSFTPNANWNGAVPVITYTTNTGAIATLTITVTPDNTDAANDSKTVVEDTVASGNVLTNDEAGNTSVVSFTVAGSSVVHNAGSSVVLTGGTLVLNSNGSYSFTPNANWNGAVPVITYTTNTGAIATLTITVTPDNTDAANDSKTVVEDTVASGNVLTNDEAGNTSVVSFTVAGSSVVHNAGSSVVLTGGTLVLNSNGSYSFTPNANWNGAVPVITYTTNTGAIATLTITVTPDNTDAANDSKTVVEDTVASGNVLTNDEAGNTSVVSFTVAGSSVVHNAGSSVVLTGGTLVLNSNGSYSFTPNANWNGAVPVITYTTNTGAIATLTITVTPDNTDAANDSKTVVEDTVASGNVLTNDEAGNTSVVSFTVAGSSVVHNAGSSVVLTGGTLVLNSNGSYSFTPNANWNGAVPVITYTTNTGAIATLTITVTPDNTDAANDSKTVVEDTVASGNVLTNDEAGNTSVVSFTVAGSSVVHNAGSSVVLTGGTLVLNSNGSYSFTPNANWNGAVPVITYTTNTGAIATLTITVTPDNTDAANDSKTVVEDTVASGNVLTNDEAGNTSVVSFTVAGSSVVHNAGSSVVLTGGTLVLNSNGSYSFTPNANWNGAVPVITYTTNTGAIATLTITVTPDNTDAANDSKTVVEDTVASGNVLTNDEAGNTSVVSFTVAGSSVVHNAGSSVVLTGGTLVLNSNGSYSFTPNANWNGAVPVITYTTNTGAIATLTITVTPDNTDAANDSKTVVEDTVASGNVLTNDEAGNTSVVSFTVAGSSVVHNAGSSVVLTGGTLVLNSNGSYSFTPNANWNGAVPVITYTTNTGAIATLTITVTPDNTDAANDSKTVVEDTVASGNVLTNDEAGNTSVVSFTVAGSSVVHNAGSSVVLTGGTLVLNSNGSYSFTPNANWNGAVPVITYTTNTGAIATLTITVTPDNTDAANDSKTVVEDTVASGNVLTNDEAGNTSVVSFTVAGSSVVHNAGSSVVLTGGTLVLNSNGSYSFTPNANWNGAVPVITYTTNTGAIATLTITVTPDNTDAANDSKTVVEDTVASGNVLTNDEAGNTSVVSFTVAGSSVVHNAGSSVVLTGGTLVLNSNGSYSFTPNANWNGAVPVITYTTNTGAIATLTITVTPDNTDAANDSKTVVEDTVASGNVLTNDEAGNTSVVSFTVAGSSVVHNAGSSVVLTGGTLVLNSNGSYSFTPNANWNGAVPVITYTTNTGAIATLTITVTPDNTDAANDSKTVVEDTVASGNVLTNDEAGNTSVVSFTVAGSSVVHNAGSSVVLTGGTLVLNSNGSYSFTPNANWNGAVPVITYTTNTGAIATLTITVTPDNTDAANDSKTVVEDTVASGNVLTNDEAGNTSVVSFTVAGSSVVHNAGSSVVLTGGTLVLNSNGSYSFTPNANWNGAVPVITYTTNTGAIATLTITVTPDNTDAANDSKTVVEDTVASGNVLTNDEAGNTSVVSFTVAGSSVVHNAGSSVVLTGGTLVLNSNGSYSFTPNANWNGAVPVITYTTNTGAIATLTITVTPDNTDAANDSKTVVEDTVASGNVLTNDEAGNTSVVSFTVAGSSVVHNAGSSVVLTGGTLVLNSNGSYSFTPNANWNGAVPVITYTTNTGAIATLTITVTPDNTDAANDSKTVVEDTVASGNVLTNDEAGNTSVVSFTVAGSSVVHNAGSSVVLTGGTLVLNSNGSYSFTPNANWNGAVPVITYTTNTGAIATLTITVTPDNTDAANDSKTVVEDTVASGNVLTNDEAGNTSVVSFTVAGSSVVHNAGSSVVLTGGTLVLNSNGSYSFTPNANWNGAVPVITYTTNTGAIATLTITVTPDNTDAANDSKTVVEDTVASGNVLTNDEAGNTSVVSFTVAGSSVVHNAGSSVVLTGGTLVLNSNGSYSFTPNANWNGAVPVITYTTNTGAIATLTITVTPDNTDAANDSKTVVEDTVASGNVLTNDEAGNTSVVSFTVAGSSVVHNAGSSVVLTGGTLVLNSNGSYSFTPNANWNGAVPVITYTTNTGAIATLTITVTPDNTDAANDSKTVVEDTVASGNVLTNDEAGNTSVVSFTVAGSSVVHNAGSSVVLTGGTLVLNSNGSYSFTPNANWNGAVPVITYTTNTGAIATLTITVTPDNTDAANDSKTVVEDTVASGNVLTNDEAGNTSVVSFTVAGSSVVHNAGSSVVLTGGTLVLNSNGSYSFTPNANWNGAVPVITYTTNTGAIATLTITVTPADDPVTIINTVGPLNVYESALANGTGNPSTGQTSAQGSMSITANDGLNRIEVTNSVGITSTLTLATLLSASLTSPIVIAGANGTLYITGYSNGQLQYTYTLTHAQTHSTQGSDTLNDNFQVKAIDTDGDFATTTITTTVHDDVATAHNDTDQLEVVLDSFNFSGIVANWTTINGGSDVRKFDGPDNDSGKDQVRWGDPASYNGSQSGYGFADNDAALNGSLSLNQDIVLGTFTHYNYPIDSGTSITSATMQITFNVTDAYGVTTPVTLTLNFSHNETPNDGPDPRDIVTVGQTSVTFNYEGQVYTMQVIGFKDSNGNIVTSIYTNENDATSYQLVVRMVAGNGYTLPHTDGNVLTNDTTGADTAVTVIGVANGDHTNTGVSGHVGTTINGLYGTLILYADGTYHYQLTASADLIPASGATETFTYTMQDGDGDRSSATLKINVSPVNADGVNLVDANAFTTQGSSLNDTIVVTNGENSSSHNRLNVTFGGGLSGIITNSSEQKIVSSGANKKSYSTTDAQIVSGGDGNDHIETGRGDDVIYAGKTGAIGYGTDDQLELSVNALSTHHIMTGTLSGTNSIVDNDGLLLANDVASQRADVVNGGSGDDRIYGQSGSDILYGHTGNDYIDGGSHNDALRGGEGNDTLIGGLGDDVLRGDSGADTFVWRYADADKGTDHIMDFKVGEDKLDLSDLLQGETANTLESYLSFSLNNGSTVIDIDANKDGTFDQHIVLDGVNLYSQFGATDNAGIINGLLGSNGNGPLIIDTAPPVTPDAPQGVTPLTDPHNNIIP
ncbi:retention module-containing protein [Shewanella xiamenensis]|nr:retention module-containing protein [Shewanella xiamenensis]